MFEVGNVGISREPVAHRAEPVLTGRGTKPEAADSGALPGTTWCLSSTGDEVIASVITTAIEGFHIECCIADTSHQIQRLLLWN